SSPTSTGTRPSTPTSCAARSTPSSPGCPVAELDALPGGDLVGRGLADLDHGRRTAEALLVLAAAGRLRALGLPVPAAPGGDVELELYGLLRHEEPDGAYGRYRALRARLASFVHALEAEEGRAIRRARGATG